MTKLIKFVVPILGTLILQAMYGVVDPLVVDQFGTDAGVSAVVTGNNIINPVTFVIISLTTGIAVLVSRYLGKKQVNRVESVIGGCVCFFTVFTTVIMVLLSASASVFASWLNAPAPTYEITIGYVGICGAEITSMVAYNVISGIFRRPGNSKLSLVFVFIACLVNIVGSLSFMVVPHVNMASAALATVLTQAISVILSLFTIRRQDLPFAVTRQDLHFNSETPVFFKLSIPLALQELLTSISLLILCVIVNGTGLEASSGYGIAQKVIFLITLISSVPIQSISTLMVQNVSAGKEEGAREAMLTGMGLGASMGVITFLISFFRDDTPTSVSTMNEAYIIKAVEYLKGFSFEAILTCLVFDYIGYFNEHGMSPPVMVQGTTASFLVRVPLSYLFSLKGGASLSNIGLAVPVTPLYGTLFFTMCYIWYIRKKR